MAVERRERGQAVALYAVLIPLTVLFALGIFDYMLTSLRVMETYAAAELAAHAGAQAIRVRPDGRILPVIGEAESRVGASFAAQSPAEAVLTSANCGLQAGRPTCRVTASVRSTGYLLPERWITVQAVGMLVHGVTEGDQ